MKLVIIDENDKVIVQYAEEDFKNILCAFFNEYDDVEEAFDATCKALRDKILKM